MIRAHLGLVYSTGKQDNGAGHQVRRIQLSKRSFYHFTDKLRAF